MWPQALIGAVAAVAAFLHRLLPLSSEQLRGWQEAAAAVGVTHIERTPDSLAGWKEGLQVRLTRFDRNEQQGTRVTLSGRALAPTLTLLAEGADSARRRHRGWSEIEIGDAAFDRAVWIEGPPLLLRAVLEAETRRILLALFDGRLVRPRLSPFCANGRLEQGVLSVELPEAPAERREPYVRRDRSVVFAGSALLSDALRATLALAGRLAPPQDPARRIADNLRSEPLPGVRRRCLTALRREAPDSALRIETRQAIAGIQGRVAGAGPGQLSLAAGEAGRLSLSESRAGRVSLVPSAEPAPTAREAE